MRQYVWILIIALLLPDVQTAWSKADYRLAHGAPAFGATDAFSPRALQMVRVLEGHGKKPSIVHSAEGARRPLWRDRYREWWPSIAAAVILLVIDYRWAPMAFIAAGVSMSAELKFWRRNPPYLVWDEEHERVGRVVRKDGHGLTIHLESGENCFVSYARAGRSLAIMADDEEEDLEPPTIAEAAASPLPTAPKSAVSKPIVLPRAQRRVRQAERFKAIAPVALRKGDTELLLDHLTDTPPTMNERLAQRTISPKQLRRILDAEIDLLNFLNAPWVTTVLLEGYGVTNGLAYNLVYGRNNLHRSRDVFHSGAHVLWQLGDRHAHIRRSQMKKVWRVLIMRYRAGQLGLNRRFEKPAPPPRKQVKKTSQTAPPIEGDLAPTKRYPYQRVREDVVGDFLIAVKRQYRQAAHDIETVFVRTLLTKNASEGAHANAQLRQFLALALKGFSLPWTQARPFPQGGVVYTGENFGIIQWEGGKEQLDARAIPILTPRGETRRMIRDVLIPVKIDKKTYANGALQAAIMMAGRSSSIVRWGSGLAAFLAATGLFIGSLRAHPRHLLAQAL